MLVVLGLIGFGVVNLIASVTTINRIGGWNSPDLPSVLDIFCVFAVIGVILVSLGVFFIGVTQLLPVSANMTCVVGPIFALGLLVTLHVTGRERDEWDYLFKEKVVFNYDDIED